MWVPDQYSEWEPEDLWRGTQLTYVLTMQGKFRNLSNALMMKGPYEYRTWEWGKQNSRLLPARILGELTYYRVGSLLLTGSVLFKKQWTILLPGTPPRSDPRLWKQPPSSWPTSARTHAASCSLTCGISGKQGYCIMRSRQTPRILATSWALQSTFTGELISQTRAVRVRSCRAWSQGEASSRRWIIAVRRLGCVWSV